MRETVMRETVSEVVETNTREITVLELATIIIKHEILSNLKQKDMVDIVDDLVQCRVDEIKTENIKMKYTEDIEAFTCEISGNRLFVIKHDTVDKAIRYAAENIGEIHIIFNGNIVVLGGETERDISNIEPYTDNLYRITLGEDLYVANHTN